LVISTASGLAHPAIVPAASDLIRFGVDAESREGVAGARRPTRQP
jgi:hypothetical protein